MGFSVKKWCDLENSIAPQMFGIKNDNLYFFDKINRHEGRFCKGNSNKGILFEIDNNIGIVSKDGDMYSIELNNNTIIKELDDDGNSKKKFFLDGIFFDFSKDVSGNYIFLGLKNERVFIEMTNNNGIKINSFIPSNIIFGCGINATDDCLYVGGIDKNNILKLSRINYIGVIIDEWLIYYCCNGKVIEKILHYGIFEILFFKEKQNNIVVLNKSNGQIIEIFPRDLGFKEFVDINIIDELVYILDGRKIYCIDIDDIIFYIPGNKKINFGIDLSAFSYIYMMYTLEFKKNFSSNIKLKTGINMVVFIILFSDNINLNKLLFGIWFCVFFTFIISITKSLFVLSNKGERIERLLKINENENFNWYGAQIYIGLLIYCVVVALIPKNFINMFIGFVSSFGVVLAISHLAINVIKKINEDIIIELLSEENNTYIEKIKSLLSKITEKKNEKFCINILADQKPMNNIITHWAQSRKHILQEEVVIKIMDDRITIILDLSKRNVKYSRLSILMDYICYVKNKMQIKKIEIDYFDKENKA